jgi:hypothetical protein
VNADKALALARSGFRLGGPSARDRLARLGREAANAAWRAGVRPDPAGAPVPAPGNARRRLRGVAFRACAPGREGAAVPAARLLGLDADFGGSGLAAARARLERLGRGLWL